MIRFFSTFYVFVSLFPFFVPLALAESTKAGHCKAIYHEVWELRAKGDNWKANSFHGKARRIGCFEPPIIDTLCPVLEEQEMKQDLKGNSGLASVIRAQKRRFNC